MKQALLCGCYKEHVLRRTRNLVKFRVERLLLRGTGMRLLLIMTLIGFISVVAGGLVQAIDHEFSGLGDAVWWAFLRLTDPGYLGDDVGVTRRLVSTLVTLLGYVVFLGALVAIMTQWLNKTIADLESGFTPIAVNDHVLVVGNTSRTVTILREMLPERGRVQRFLDLHDAGRLHLVLLSEEVGPQLRFELREQLGKLFSDKRVVLRSGSPLRVEHLRRVDFLNAAAILLPSDDLSSKGAQAADTRTIKTLLSMSRRGPEQPGEELPLVVAEVLDQRRVMMAVRAYAGPVEVVASDLLVGCMLAQTILYRGVSGVFDELLMRSDGNNLHVIYDDAMVGRRFEELAPRFPHAVVLGLVRRRTKSFGPILAPAPGRVVGDGEAVVVIARSHEESLPRPLELGPRPRQDDLEEPPPRSRRRQRVLILGWSSHVPSMVTELAEHPHVQFKIVIASVVPPKTRTNELATYGTDLSGVTIKQVRVDFTVPASLRKLNPSRYDDVILMASDWPASDEEADARTIVAYLLLRELLRRVERRPRIAVELADPANRPLFDPDVSVLVTPVVVGLILAQVTLRPELRAVYEDLLGLRGAELSSYDADDFGILEEGPWSFEALSEAVARRQGVLVGMHAREADGSWDTHVNPPKDSEWLIEEGVRLVVLNQPSLT